MRQKREAIFIFTDITINDKGQLKKLLRDTEFDSYEYSFATLMAWQHIYYTKFDLKEDYGLILGNCTKHEFATMPLGKPQTWKKSLEAMKGYFTKNDQPLIIHGVNEDYVNWINKREDGYICSEDIDNFEYVYLGETLRTLKGRNLSHKRNHINAFLKNYYGRYEYRVLGKKDQEDCMQLLQEWIDSKEVSDSTTMEEERQAIKVMFQYMEELEIKAGGIYIDNKLKGFTLGELINGNTAHIFIEKCDGNIRGLYPFINQQFMVNSFPEAELVNREEDMGLEGLRKAKKSYNPDHMIKKYVVMESEQYDCATCAERREKKD